ncbi:actin-depolymerizing factor [Quercus suber]|uniref:Actin-depolymerizing factor n=1 Tax=Quercus suber TaxID=58331 RepID=A0AAW0J2I2_QUESU
MEPPRGRLEFRWCRHQKDPRCVVGEQRQFFHLALHLPELPCEVGDTIDSNYPIDRIYASVVYASSKDRFKSQLDGIQVELRATVPSEMSFDIVKGRTL